MITITVCPELLYNLTPEEREDAKEWCELVSKKLNEFIKTELQHNLYYRGVSK